MNFTKVTSRTLALSATAILLLAGCGNADDETIDPVDTTQAPPADDETSNGADDTADTGDGTGEDGADDTSGSQDGNGAAQDGDDGGDTGSGEGAGDHAGVLAAIDLAQQETGGTAFEVDDADGGNWEIYIASGEDELEVLISTDGTEVLDNEREGSLDSEDRAGLEAATITISEAIEIAAEHGTGQIDDVNLDDEDGGIFAWEVTFTDDTEVYINVADGEILRVETD